MVSKADQTKQLQTLLVESYGINLPLEKLKKVIDAYFTVVRDNLLEGESINNPVFGTLSTYLQSERTGIHRAGILKEGDPRIGQEWVRPAHLAVKFRPSAEFKAMLLNSTTEP